MTSEENQSASEVEAVAEEFVEASEDLVADQTDPVSSDEPSADVEAEGSTDRVPEVSANWDFEKLKKIVEGAIFTAAKPMTIEYLGKLFLDEERPTKNDFNAVLQSLMEDYADRGVKLKEVSSGYRFQATEEVGMWVSRMWEEKPARYSRALLETLALIAYRQPITRGEIEEIRGVSTSSHIMKTLQEREWIRVVGHRDVPGRPAMYATTRLFLDYFNLQNIDELPSLAEIRDLDEINRELDLAAGEAPQANGQEETAEAVVDQQSEPESEAVDTVAMTAEVDDSVSDVSGLPDEASGSIQQEVISDTNGQETEAETD